MMNRKALLIVSLFVFIIFNLTTIAQSKKKSDAELEGLKGKVMSVKDEYYVKERIFFGLLPVKKIYRVECSTFNKDGKIICMDLPGINGGENRYIDHYKYNKIGSCIEMLRLDYPCKDKWDSSLLKFTFIYDKYGNEIEENHFFNEKLLYRYNYKYDNKGYLIEAITYENNNDSVSFKVTYIRDTNGNELEVRRYDKLDEIDLRLINEYDEKNNKVKEQKFKKDNKLIYTITYKYNKEGDEIERNQIRGNSIYFESYKYKYDSKGNWIKRIEYNEDGTISYIIKRKIKYYKD